MLFNSTEGAHDFGNHCKYDSESSGNGMRVQSRGSHLNPNKQTSTPYMNQMATMFVLLQDGTIELWLV